MNLVETLLNRIADKRRRIVVIGDVMIDRWVHGRLEPCQDGCQKFVQDHVIETPGGAANAEQCLEGWCVNTTLSGDQVLGRPIKTRYVADGKIVFRSDDEDRPRCNFNIGREYALEMIQRASAVLLSDYDKGMLTPEFIQHVAAVCRERSIPCVADCKRAPEVYERCVLKCNAEWAEKYGIVDVVTCGCDAPTGKTFHLANALPKVQCVNHVGAGDCFAAHLTLALAYGFSLKEAAALAHSAGRVYVQHPHNRPPLPSEIASDLSSAM